MAQEARLLMERLQERDPLGGRRAWSGRLAGRPVVLQLSGMGMVNAAAAVAAALEAMPELAGVINLGCAGAFGHSGLQEGQAVLADAAVLADLGVQAGDHLHGIEKTGIALWQDQEGQEYFNHIPVDPELSDRLDRAAGPLPRGLFATVGRVSGDAEAAEQVSARWGAVVEEMESAAVGLVALQRGIPFAAVRGVSNVVGHREFNLAAGAEAAQRVLLALEDL